MRTWLPMVVAYIFALIFTVFIGAIFAFPVKWLWNYAVAPTCGWAEVSWGQAWCLLILSALLFKSTSNK